MIYSLVCLIEPIRDSTILYCKYASAEDQRLKSFGKLVTHSQVNKVPMKLSEARQSYLSATDAYISGRDGGCRKTRSTSVWQTSVAMVLHRCHVGLKWKPTQGRRMGLSKGGLYAYHQLLYAFRPSMLVFTAVVLLAFQLAVWPWHIRHVKEQHCVGRSKSLKPLWNQSGMDAVSSSMWHEPKRLLLPISTTH